MNAKYVVFKREDWEAWLGEDLSGTDEEVTPIPELTDAVVIRLQDVFAESALWTYANEIRAALEILHLLGVNGNSHPQVERLQQIADYFADMADEAGKAGKKVPD